MRSQRCYGSRVVFMFLLMLLINSMTLIEATDSDAESNGTVKDEKIEFPEQHWGTYYDPSNVFCGEYDCYKILGFDYETWGRSPPTKKEITQSYRSLSRRWHPDKNRDKGAEDRFVKISKAYKILTNDKKRKEFDHMRERPDEYFYKYGKSVYIPAPKTDTVIVVTLLIFLGCAFTWYAQKNRWQQVADRVIKDAVDPLKAGDGGPSRESLDVRAKAQEILRLTKEKEAENDDGVAVKKSKVKLTKKEIKDKENEELRPIIVELVNEIQDFGFGAGFHQPTWRDILIVKMVQWPIPIFKGLVWETKFYVRRIMKKELNDNEREVLTCRAVGQVAWKSASDEEKKIMIDRELWITSNLEEWLEFYRFGMSAGQQKKYARVMKKESKKKD